MTVDRKALGAAARREVERHKTRLGQQRKRALGIAEAVDRILISRRWRRLTLADVARLTVSVKKLKPFLITSDWRPTLLADRADLRPLIAPPAKQMELFAA